MLPQPRSSYHTQGMLLELRLILQGCAKMHGWTAVQQSIYENLHTRLLPCWCSAVESPPIPSADTQSSSTDPGYDPVYDVPTFLHVVDRLQLRPSAKPKES